MNKKVVVIGAGFGGLGSAILLARAGYDVTVIEKNDKVGGRANLLERDGYRRDMGPSWYLMPDAFDRFFTAIGRKVEDYLDLQKLEPSYRVFFKEGKDGKSAMQGYEAMKNGANYLDLYADVDKAATTFESIEQGSGDKLKAYLKSAAYQYGIAMEKFVFKNFDSIRDFMTPQLAIEGLQLNVFTKLYNYVSRFVKNENLKKLLMYPSVFLGTSPYQTPALFNIMSHVDFNQGVFYPQGGIHEIPKALYQIALEEGVKFEFNTEVEKIIVEDKKVIGIQITPSPTTEYQQTIEGYHDHFDDYLNNVSESLSDYPSLKEFLDTYISHMSSGSEIIEIGSGSGRDADYLELHNLSVTRTELTQGLIDFQHKKGKVISQFDLLKDVSNKKYNGLCAFGVLCHFNPQQFEYSLVKINELLVENGIAAFDVKFGDGEEFNLRGGKSFPRYFKLWSEDQAISIIQSKGFEVIHSTNTGKRIHFIIKKIKPINNIIATEIIISNADMRHTETQLLEVSQQTYPESYWAKQVISPSGFILYLGVDGELPQLKHHTLVFSDDWKGGFDQIFQDPQRPQDPNYYICNPSKTDPSVAPAGKENLFVLVPIAPGLDSTPESLEAYRDNIIADIAHNCGIPDLQDRIEVSQIFSIPQFEQYYNAYKGTALGLAHTFFQSAVRRPQNYSKKIKGLYYAGGYTTPGIGMPMCLISAMMVADRVEKNK